MCTICGHGWLELRPQLVIRVQVTRGVMYTKQEAEGKRLKNPFDTITEGIGINRQTANFSLAHIDGAFQGTDREAVEMVCCILPTPVALVPPSPVVAVCNPLEAAVLA